MPHRSSAGGVGPRAGVGRALAPRRIHPTLVILDRTNSRRWRIPRRPPARPGTTTPAQGVVFAGLVRPGRRPPPSPGHFGRFLGISTGLHVVGGTVLLAALTLPFRGAPADDRPAVLRVAELEEEVTFVEPDPLPPDPVDPEDEDELLEEAELVEVITPPEVRDHEDAEIVDLPFELFPDPDGAFQFTVPEPPPDPEPIEPPPPAPPVPVVPAVVEPIPDVEPVLVEGPSPPYPTLARRRHWEGTVTCRITIGKDGSVLAVVVEESSGYRVLDEAACKALLAWRFTPGTRNGEASVRDVLHLVTFQIEDP